MGAGGRASFVTGEETGERGKKEVQKGEDVEKKMIYREEKVKLSRVESRGTEQTN